LAHHAAQGIAEREPGLGHNRILRDAGVVQAAVAFIP